MKTAFVFAIGIMGTVLSQGHVSAQPIKKVPFESNDKVLKLETPDSRKLIPMTPSLQTLANTVSELQDTVSSLKKEVASLKADLKKTNASLEMVKASTAAPAGYTTTWMSKGFFERQKSSELIRIHVQVPTK